MSQKPGRLAGEEIVAGAVGIEARWQAERL
jgi:hypothetical protein